MTKPESKKRETKMVLKVVPEEERRERPEGDLGERRIGAKKKRGMNFEKVLKIKFEILNICSEGTSLEGRWENATIPPHNPPRDVTGQPQQEGQNLPLRGAERGKKNLKTVIVLLQWPLKEKTR